MVKVRVLCIGWMDYKNMYLTYEQLEQWRDNPMVLKLEVLDEDGEDLNQ